MLIPLDKLRQFYDRILQNALDPQLKGATTVQIFVTNETDSLCSLKILTNLFKSDELQYVQTPVFNNEQLREEINKLRENKTIRSIVFINCGGVLNQTAFWYYSAPQRIEAFIFDSHRPFSHMNLNDPQSKIYIVHDGCRSFQQYPSQSDYQDYQNYINSLAQNGYDDYDSEEDEEGERNEEGSEDELDDEEEDEEKKEIQQELEDLKGSDDEEDVYGGTKVRRDQNMNEDDDAEVIDGGDQDDLDSIAVGAKRNSNEQEPGLRLKDQRKLKRQKRQMVKNYYSGYFYHKSASYLMYQVCQSLNRESKEALWLWIVGMTDQMIHYKQQSDAQDEDKALANEEVQRLNPNVYNNEFNDLPVDEDEEQQAGDEEAKNDRRNQEDLFKMVQVQSKNLDLGTIIMTQELRLMLLRHWSLFESLNNSNYTVSQLKLWKEPGKKDLMRFLARIGISLEEAKQSYNFMSPQMRKDLRSRFLKAAVEFDLKDIVQSTFLLQLDQKTQILATDMAYSISAILESPRNMNPKMAGISMNGNTATNGFKTSGDINNLLSTRVSGVTLNQNSLLQKDLEIKERLAYQSQCRYDNFYVALDALERKNKHLLDKGIEMARELQMAIISFGTSIIEKKQIRPMDRYRYCFIDYDQMRDIELFHYPQALSKLALFLQQMYQRVHKVSKTKPKPFVLAVKNNKKGTTLLVAVLGNAMELSSVSKNNFNQMYRTVIRQKNIRASNDSFDTSIIEINNEDVQPFFDEFNNQWGSLQGTEAF